MGTGDEWWTIILADMERLSRGISNIGWSDGDCSKLSVSEGLIRRGLDGVIGFYEAGFSQ